MNDNNFLNFGVEETSAPLIVMLHGRGTNEASLANLATSISSQYRIISLRGPIELGPSSYTWFQNRGIGRPIPESLRQSLEWFYKFIDSKNPNGSPIAVVGFSGGAAFAGAVALDKRVSLSGTAILYGTIPFDAGLSTEKDSLAHQRIFVAQGIDDSVMPTDLMTRTWDYLHNDSGAELEAHRSQGGHEITPEVAIQLDKWINNIIDSKI